MHVVNVTVII